MPRRSQDQFTDMFVRTRRALPDKPASFFDGLVPGLELRVHPSGRKVFGFRYRDAGGRSIRLKIGDYPAVSVKHARTRALDARNRVSNGADPQDQRRRLHAEETAKRIRTVGDLIDAYLESIARRVRASTLATNRHRLERHVRSRFGNLRLEALTRADIKTLINDLDSAGHPVTANRVAALIGTIYRHANEHLDLKVENPAIGLASVFNEASRERTLSDQELRKLWTALDDPARAPVALSAPMAVCLQLCAITLARCGEVCGMHDREIDLDQRMWIIPASRSKNRREHLVPLSPPAVERIRLARSLRGERNRPDFVFPSPVNRNEPLARHSVSRAMQRLCDTLEIENATTHDLRRSGASNLTSERINIPRFIVSHVLGHVSETGGVTGVYDRNSYASEKRKALDAWANLLQQIVNGRERDANVVMLEFRQ